MREYQENDGLRLMSPVFGAVHGGGGGIIEIPSGSVGTVVYVRRVGHSISYEVEFPVDPPYVGAIAAIDKHVIDSIEGPSGSLSFVPDLYSIWKAQQSEIPGQKKLPGVEVCYLEASDLIVFGRHFSEIVNVDERPLPYDALVVRKNVSLTLPNGRSLYALMYHDNGDEIERRILDVAKRDGLLVGHIVDVSLVLYNGVKVPLRDCRSNTWCN